MNTFTELTSLEMRFADFLTLLKRLFLKIKISAKQAETEDKAYLNGRW